LHIVNFAFQLKT